MVRLKVLALALLTAGAAQATTLPPIPEVDFTNDSVWESGASKLKLFADTSAESTVSLASVNGAINFTQNFDGDRTGVCGDSGGVLVCNNDGLGVNDDEISRTGLAVAEEVTVSFSAPVILQGLHFLDLFYRNADRSQSYESALVFANGALTPLAFTAQQRNNTTAPGYLFVDIAKQFATPLVVSSLRFVPGQGNDTFDGLIRNGNRPDFALGAIDVAPVPVPLPLGAVLMLTAVAGFATWGRRRAA